MTGCVTGHRHDRDPGRKVGGIELAVGAKYAGRLGLLEEGTGRIVRIDAADELRPVIGAVVGDRVGEERLPILHEPSDVVEMQVRHKHEVDLVRTDTDLGERRR